MSKSKRAKERRTKRSQLSKHERKVIAEQPKQEQRQVAEERPVVQDTPRRGIWTRCSCGHIAQEHSKDGRCEECACSHYDGECKPFPDDVKHDATPMSPARRAFQNA